MSEQEMTPTPEEEDFVDELSDEALDRQEGAAKGKACAWSFGGCATSNK